METTPNGIYTLSSNEYAVAIRMWPRSGNLNYSEEGQSIFTCSFLGDGSTTVSYREHGTALPETIFTVGTLRLHALKPPVIAAVLSAICSNIYAKKYLISQGMPTPTEAWERHVRERISGEYGVCTIDVVSLWRLIDWWPLTLPLFWKRSTDTQKLSVVRIDCKA